MSSKKVTFKGALGVTLAGRLDLPDGKMKASALFAHCFTCSKSLKVVGNIAKSCWPAKSALLIGHSLSGAAVIQSAHRILSARAVVTIGAPSDPGHETRHIETHLV